MVPNLADRNDATLLLKVSHNIRTALEIYDLFF